MSTTDDEARTEAYERNPVSYRAGYAAGQATRKVKAAPSDTDREALDKLVDDWRARSRHAGRNSGDIPWWRGYALARKEDADELERVTARTSQPVQVEITEETVERMARMLFAQTTEARSGFTWPINGDWGRERDMEQARRALEYVLTAALGGGE